MPKLPRLTSKAIIAILQTNGFELDHTTGSHYIFTTLILNDERLCLFIDEHYQLEHLWQYYARLV